MANSLPPRLATGTLGEVLVQIRLLQFGVQAAPPIVDTGNDLVAFRGHAVRTIQVKTSSNKIPQSRRLPDRYDVLALVVLGSFDGIVSLDKSRIFLIPCKLARETKRNLSTLERYELRHDAVAQSMWLLDKIFRGKR